MRSTRRVPAELPYPQGPVICRRAATYRRIRVSTQRTTGRRKQAAAAAAVVAALLSTAACGGGGSDDERRLEERRGRLQRSQQQGRAGLPRQEGRRAEVRRRPGRRLVGHHARLLRLRLELHARYYSRTLVTGKTEPGAKRRRGSPRTSPPARPRSPTTARPTRTRCVTGSRGRMASRSPPRTSSTASSASGRRTSCPAVRST